MLDAVDGAVELGVAYPDDEQFAGADFPLHDARGEAGEHTRIVENLLDGVVVLELQKDLRAQAARGKLAQKRFPRSRSGSRSSQWRSSRASMGYGPARPMPCPQ